MKHRLREPAPLLRGYGLSPRLLLIVIGLLRALQAVGETSAADAGGGMRWQAEKVFQFSARTDHASTLGQLERRDAIVSTTHLRFKSSVRPITAGLMLEYAFVDRHADTLLVAGMFTYKQSQWTVSASPYYVRTVHRAAGDWRYWGSVRRQVTPRHSVGIELFGALETGRLAKWMVGYSATITGSLSFSLSAGSAFDVGPDWMARTSLTWRPRSSRN